MKYLILIASLFLTGCGGERYFLVPSNNYNATFSTKDYKESKSFEFTGWEEKDSNNTYIVAKKDHFEAFFADAKNDKANYNLLLKNIKLFNSKIIKQNEYQKTLEPKEVKTL